MDTHATPISDLGQDEVTFNHPDDRAIWTSMRPANDGPVSAQDGKTFAAICQKMEEKFRIENKERFFKFLKRCYKLNHGADDHLAYVPVHTFIQLTKNFGPFTKVGDSCVFVNQMQALMNATQRQNNTLVSAFAGHMTQEEAEAILLPDTIQNETYLARFSESLADKGGFSLAVKANAADVRHYNILGDASAAARSEPYHARLKLIHRVYNEQNEDETEYRDIVTFLNNRLDDKIEDNIYCTHICPNLPFNALFRGYD